jgi:hypothetical protein
MISDKLLTFADDTALNTGAAGDYVIGDQVDLGVTTAGIGAMIGAGALYLVITVEDAATSGGSATASFSLLTSAASNLGSPTVIATTPVVPVASMTAGALVYVAAVPITDDWLRYIGLRQTTGTAAFLTGSVNAFLTTTPPHRYSYPNNPAISW